MSVITNPVEDFPTRHLPRWRAWTRVEFMRACTLGVFAPDEKLELIEGEIVQKMPQNGPHATAIYLMQCALLAIFGPAFMVRVQLPLALGENSQPEPDVCVVEGDAHQFSQDHPTTASLVVEVADATVETDRSVKAALYARAGITEYWIVNVNDRTLEVHRQPSEITGMTLGYGYRSIQILDADQQVAPLQAPENLISVAQLLP